jgi:integrase
MPRTHLNADEILDTDDVNKLLEATDSHYYKALIAVLFETGARIGELQALRVSDF